MLQTNKFKNPSGQHYLNSLFFEMVGADKSTVVYSLKDEDHEGFQSLRRLFLSARDLTEYKFASVHLDGWVHWEKLLDCAWFKPYILRWRRELETLIRSEALSRIAIIAASGGKEALSANKYLIEATEKAAGGVSRGRPRRGSGASSESLLQASQLDIEADSKRMFS